MQHLLWLYEILQYFSTIQYAGYCQMPENSDNKNWAVAYLSKSLQNKAFEHSGSILSQLPDVRDRNLHQSE